MQIKLESELADELGSEGYLALDGFEYEFIENSDKTDEGKYVTWDSIYWRSDGKFFVQYNSKSGSHFSDYEFYYGEELYEVTKKEVTVTEWVRV
jgi:hypothetical protein